MAHAVTAQAIDPKLRRAAMMAQTLPARGPAGPRIIMQAVPNGGLDVAAWSADSRYIYTAAGLSRELLVWDAEDGVIIDRLRLPADPYNATEMMRLHAMRWLPDGRTLRIEGEVLDTSDKAAEATRAPRAYLFNVETRSLFFDLDGPPPPLPPLGQDETLQSHLQRWIGAQTTLYEGGNEMTTAEANAVMPRLPASPDGKWRMVREKPGFVLADARGATRAMAGGAQLMMLDSADLSPDGRLLALLDIEKDVEADDSLSSRVDLFDPVTARFSPSIHVPGDLNRVIWRNNRELYVLPEDSSDDPQDGATAGPLPDLKLVEVATGRTLVSAPGRCFMALLPDGSLLGAGPANCRTQVGKDRRLLRLTGGQWQPYPTPLPADAIVRAIAASPRGDRFVVALQRGDDSELVIVDAASGARGASVVLAGTAVNRLGFSPDGRRVVIVGDMGTQEWRPDADGSDPAAPALRPYDLLSLWAAFIASDGRNLMIAGALDERIARVDPATGKKVSPLDLANVVGAGVLPGKPVIWAVSALGALKLWDARTGLQLANANFTNDQHFVSLAPDGRYDTNLGPDSEAFTWFVSDSPFEALAPQTFMRDYFSPRLLQKLVDCTSAANCATVMPPPPPITGLNRLLPDVEITGVAPHETDAGDVWVDVSITEGVSADGRKRSGLYGLKLLMNGREVGRDPDDPNAEPPRDLAEWRKANFIKLDNGHYDYRLRATIPSDGKPIDFAVYAFNIDRVKSDTAHFKWQPPRQTPRPRRAFVLTIGVDDYAEARLRLNFAVADAGLIANRLAAIPGYEMRRASLTTGRKPDGSPRTVTSDDIQLALALLGGLELETNPRTALAAAGHDVSALAEATPDDLVIISFSGHGYADASGRFALLPSDTAWPAASAAPTLDTTVTADDLTGWLRYVNAGEFAFIIDACHSGAAVATPDFKAGPMGDPGLGQLAFDKGIRILAATQADDVALENASLKQGLLTAALGEGLGDTSLPADLNRDGRVQLDEWLRYAVARLPSLNEEVRRGGGPMVARGFTIVQRTPAAAAAKPRVQEPSLFDFNQSASPVVLRGRP